MEYINLVVPIKNGKVYQKFGEDFSWRNPQTGEYQLFYKSYGLLGHPGLDYAYPVGTPIYASHNGTVFYAGYDNTNGNLIQIWDKTYKTLYGHLSEIKVKQGDQVKVGDLIGLVGNTGASTGPHLHFGIKETTELGATKYPNNGYNGAIDPEPYFNNMNLKKETGKPHIYFTNDKTMTKVMVVDMETLNALGGEYTEVADLSTYSNAGTFVWVPRTIN